MVYINYTFPAGFIPNSQVPNEQSESGQAQEVPIWLSMQRVGNKVFFLPRSGKTLLSKTFIADESGNYVFTMFSFPIGEDATGIYSDMCMLGDRLLLVGQSEGKAAIRISAKNKPTFFEDFLNEDGSLKLTGSYFETLLSEPLTACCPYDYGVILFNSAEMFILQGTNTGNYRTTKIADIGCQFKDTAVNCQNVLYWLSFNGVYAFSGGYPQKISDKLPNISQVQSACGGTDGLRYYLSVKYSNGAGALYVYSPQNGSWIQEDEQPFNSFAFHDGHLRAVNASQLLTFDDKRSDEKVPWMFETAISGEGDETLKRLRAVILDIEGEDKYPITVSIVPETGTKIALGSFYADSRAVYRLPVFTCAHQMQSLVMEGRGSIQIYSLSKEYIIGGVRNVVANPQS